MTRQSTRHRVSVNAHYNVQAMPAMACYRLSMQDGWYNRLLVAVEKDGRSKRDLSKAAGRGVNFVQQLFRNGKEPGADKLASLLDALGPEAALYVMTGLEMSAEDQAFLKLLSTYDRDQKKAVRALIEAALLREAGGSIPSSPQPTTPPIASE